MLKIIKIDIIKDFTLNIKFQNGEEKICNLSPFLEKGAFKELKDIALFKKIKNTGFSIEWDNELDLSSDTLYAIGLPL